MNSNIFVFLALLIGATFVCIVLVINYRRYKRASSKMLEQILDIENEWKKEFWSTALHELTETQAGKQLLSLEGISEETLTSEPAFWKIGDRIYYMGKEIILSSRSRLLLSVLIESGDEVVRKEELARQISEDNNTVTDATLSEAMRRLKQELKTTEQSEELILFIPEQGFVLRQNEEIKPFSKKTSEKPG